MSASSCRTMLSVRLTSSMLLPMSCVQSSCEGWRLLALFFITASRPASGEVRVSWYWADPSPALLCLSWSFALMPSYRSNMTYVSTPFTWWGAISYHRQDLQLYQMTAKRCDTAIAMRPLTVYQGMVGYARCTPTDWRRRDGLVGVRASRRYICSDCFLMHTYRLDCRRSSRS